MLASSTPHKPPKAECSSFQALIKRSTRDLSRSNWSTLAWSSLPCIRRSSVSAKRQALTTKTGLIGAPSSASLERMARFLSLICAALSSLSAVIWEGSRSHSLMTSRPLSSVRCFLIAQPLCSPHYPARIRSSAGFPGPGGRCTHPTGGRSGARSFGYRHAPGPRR